MENLFSYGTLRDERVQRAVFGRIVEGAPDAIVGWRLEPFEIKDERAVAISGMAVHTILVATGQASDEIAGSVFALTKEELQFADDYEDEGYERIRVTLKSGANAWIYVKAGERRFI